MNGNIVFASPLGRFGYLNDENVLAPLDLRVPMGLERLRESPLMEDPLFSIGEFRTHDLFARDAGNGRWELYASFSRFQRENCFQFVVARTMLETTEHGVRPVDGEWEDVFVARPGCIRYKDHSWRFIGTQASGRMQMLNETTMLISVGDHQFDGFNDAWNAPMDPETDIGKIVALDLTTRQSRIYASGFRNPQGLVVRRDGTIWETEHGPQGGDEINNVREGANYGWPLVTYGMNYGYPRRNWPTDPRPGHHEGYERPAWAFTPSVGTSNLIEADPDEFPNWRGDLLLTSLRASTLFHVRTYENRVIYIEPVHVFGRERLRDIISRRDGTIVIMTDLGSLIFVRNAERHADAPREFTVTGLSTLSDPLPEEAPIDDTGPPVPRGRQMYSIGCAQCHSLAGEIGIGPPLNGVVGRRVGAVEGYGYSPALANYDGVWTEELLRSFITEPERHFRGTTMPPASISWIEAPNIIAFLRTTQLGDTPMEEEAAR
ncbi:MAG: PQQ-dependent sugar dehydrogenase [Hyphomonadaceae bacterium]